MIYLNCTLFPALQLRILQKRCLCSATMKACSIHTLQWCWCQRKRGIWSAFTAFALWSFCLKAHGFLVYHMFALVVALMLFIVMVSAIILIFMGLLMVITTWRFVQAVCASLHSKTPVFFFPGMLSYFMNAVGLTGGLDPSDPQSFYIFGLLASSSSTDPLALSLVSPRWAGSFLWAEWYSTIASGVAQTDPVPSTSSAFLQACTPHVRAPYGSSTQL